MRGGWWGLHSPRINLGICNFQFTLTCGVSPCMREKGRESGCGYDDPEVLRGRTQGGGDRKSTAGRWLGFGRGAALVPRLPHWPSCVGVR